MRFLLPVVLLALGFAFAGQAYGLGVGVYATNSGGDADWEDDDNADIDFNTDTEQSAFGIAFDTNLSKNHLFNYRLGVEFGTITYEDEAGDDLELDEIAITNDFGFSVFRREGLRIWGGPQARISFQDGKKSGSDWSGFGFGVGPVLGVNWNLGSNGLTLFAKGGYIFSASVLEAERDLGDQTFLVEGGSGFFNAGIIYRFDEQF